MSSPTALRSPRVEMALVFGAFVALWLLLDRLAAMLASYRGELGLVVCLVVVGAAIGIEMALQRSGPLTAAAKLGLGGPNRQGTAAACLLSIGMLLFYPVFSALHR